MRTLCDARPRLCIALPRYKRYEYGALVRWCECRGDSWIWAGSVGGRGEERWLWRGWRAKEKGPDLSGPQWNLVFPFFRDGCYFFFLVVDFFAPPLRPFSLRSSSVDSP